MLRAVFLAAPLAVLSLTSTAPAQTGEAQIIIPDSHLSEAAPDVRALFEDMGLYEILQIMSAEGLESATTMEADMFPGQGGAAWAAVVAGIYSADRLIDRFERNIPLDNFNPDTLAELNAFYDSDVGQRIAQGEVAARRAFLAPGAQDVAEAIVAERRAENDPRLDLLAEFNDVNDLVERNVSGALNANFAFFRGLSDGDAFAAQMPEDLMLSEVWGQEPEIRNSTTEWLYAYQTTAYEGLSDGDLRAYIDISQTEAGRALNAALFQAFDIMFEQISYELGAAAAVFIAGEET